MKNDMGDANPIREMQSPVVRDLGSTSDGICALFLLQNLQLHASAPFAQALDLLGTVAARIAVEFPVNSGNNALRTAGKRARNNVLLSSCSCVFFSPQLPPLSLLPSLSPSFPRLCSLILFRKSNMPLRLCDMVGLMEAVQLHARGSSNPLLL